MVRRFRQAGVLLAAWLALGAPTPAVAADVPTRIVSINLCTDELLLALADPAQIADLSIYATDPSLSYFAAEASHFRHDAGAAEIVVGIDPDLVLAGRFTRRATRDLLKQLGYRLVELDAAHSVADSIGAIRQVAALVGHPERGESLIAAIEAARVRAESTAERTAGRTKSPSVVFYQRRGYVTGGDTLTSELLGIVGLTNIGGSLAGKNGGFVSLERLIADPPDDLVVSSLMPSAEDQGSALLAHPALLKLFPPQKRIALPEKLTVCGGPSLPAAFDWLAAQSRRVSQAR